MALLQKSRDYNKLNNKAKKKELKLTDLIIPIIGVIIFALLSIFVYIPSITQAIALREELSEIKSDIDNLTALNEKLSQESISTYEEDFEKLNIILPEKLEVAEFAYYVDKLAIEKKLQLNELRASNTLSEASTEENAFEGVKVSGPVKYSGKYEDLIDFLDKLQSTSPYLTTIENLKLEKSTGEIGDNWSIEMSISAIYNGSSTISNVSNRNYRFAPYYANEQALQLLLDRSEKIIESRR
jgi:Tfp pilus assembly protein PilO